MKDHNDIRNFIQTRRFTESLVLCTLVRKSGSSYRGLGAKKVVSLSGEALGFLSGGCLEASIEKAARERFTEIPFVASFSTLAEEDRLLGYQTGCQGVIDILFENANTGNLDLLIPFGAETKFKYVRVDLSEGALGTRMASNEARDEAEVIFEKWQQPVRLFIIGCGADADVYGPLVQAMGWNVNFIDYRASLMSEGRFAPHQARTVSLSEIGYQIPNGDRVAVVLMTHNYEADLEILKSLKNHKVGYLGCLGPAVRFEKLQEDLFKLHGDCIAQELHDVAFAPAGIFKHGKSPEEIALSIIAQIQGQLNENDDEPAWILILAAGKSERFASPKALAKIDGLTLLEHALGTAGEVSGENILVVTGAHDFSGLLSKSSSVRNPSWETGMGHSLAFGLRSILDRAPKAEMIVILPVDQPRVTGEHIHALTSAARAANRCALTSSDKVSGPPAAIPKAFFKKVLQLNGDSGLKSALKMEEVIYVENKMALQDADTPAELNELLQTIHARAERFEQA